MLVQTFGRRIRALMGRGFIESAVGADEGPHAAGEEVSSGIGEEEGGPTEMGEDGSADDGLDEVAKVPDHVDETGGGTGIGAADIDDARPISALPEIVSRGGDA